MEKLTTQTCEGVSEKEKHFVGVSKLRNKWQARVWHPVLKFHIYLGSTYDSAEEAAAAIEKKKAEFEKMFKGENSVETFGDDFVGRKLPSGVSRRGFGRWGARIWHPGLRYNASLGSYGSPDEAEVVVNKMKEVYRKVYRGRKRVRRSSDGVADDVLEDAECGDISASECLDDNAGVFEVPNDVRESKSGKWVAGIGDFGSSARICLGGYSITNVEEAVRAYNDKEFVLAANRRRAELAISECWDKLRPDFEAVDAAEERECELGYGFLNSVNGKSNYGEVDDAPDKLHCGFLHYSPESVTYLVDSDGGNVSQTCQESQQRTNCASNFEEAMSLGFINEYGQLLGDYSILDEQMELSLSDEGAQL